MSEEADATATQVTDGQADVPPYRYTAAMAGEIEACWQDFWQEKGTFNAPNPTGTLSDPDASALRRAQEAVS